MSPASEAIGERPICYTGAERTTHYELAHGQGRTTFPWGARRRKLLSSRVRREHARYAYAPHTIASGPTQHCAASSTRQGNGPTTHDIDTASAGSSPANYCRPQLASQTRACVCCALTACPRHPRTFLPPRLPSNPAKCSHERRRAAARSEHRSSREKSAGRHVALTRW